MLVFAPKTCVQSVWLNEVEKFFPDEFRAGAALAPNRAPAFHIINDVVATNHDAVKWLLKQTPTQQKNLLSGFDTLIWDESDTLRHNSARTKAALKLTVRTQWKYKACLTGTPFNKSVAELFFQTKFLDGGMRLGASFYKFRSVICEPVQVGPGINHIQWHDKDDSPGAVAGLIQDITIRHELDACVEMPDITHRKIVLDLPPKLRKAYNAMRDESVLLLKKDEAIALNAAIVTSKLIQLCSGSIYGQKGAHIIDTGRAELAIELARESQPTLIFYNFEHQLASLKVAAAKAGMIQTEINGKVSTENRTKYVELFQCGMTDVMLLQINSAAHGITLTNSHRAVFMSPPYSPSLYKQAFGRIYRKGQKHKCEVILLAARNTLEQKIVQTLICLLYTSPSPRDS